MTWMLDDGVDENHARRLRALIESGETLAVPGVFNPMTGIMARKIGFDALYFSGAAFSASLGIPDIGLFTLDELTIAVRWVVKASKLPLIVDANPMYTPAFIWTMRSLPTVSRPPPVTFNLASSVTMTSLAVVTLATELTVRSPNPNTTMNPPIDRVPSMAAVPNTWMF